MRRTTAARWLLVVAAAGAQGGCLTQALWEGYLDSAPDTEVRRLPGAKPKRILRAVRAADGVYHLEAAYADGLVRCFRFDPAGGDASDPVTWPSAARAVTDADGNLPCLEPTSGEPPAGAVPLRVEGGSRHDRPPPPAGAPAGLLPTRDVDGRPTLRLVGSRVELREGGAEFRGVALLPRGPRREVRAPAGTTARGAVVGGLVVLATPVTAVIDVAAVGAAVMLVVGGPSAISFLAGLC